MELGLIISRSEGGRKGKSGNKKAAPESSLFA